MIRRIIKIDEDKCNGCGLCAKACHEDAISVIDGKARLVSDDYCDGLGNCLPVCPEGAISFEEREAAAYDEAAVKARQMKKKRPDAACGCPGSATRTIHRRECQSKPADNNEASSRLSQWPVQLKLVPVNAPYFADSDLLIAADCTAYAYGDFHERFIKGRIVLIGCPKLDSGSYAEKLTAILAGNNVKSVTVVRMEVPCCGGLANAAVEALKNCGKMIPWQTVTLSTDGTILE
ncbi:MAG: 2-ketoisovalerate ferredoxin oxidoreductase subunit delta [Firmicutes bacterium ADurb.Bin182]|nr:MAG: 2-ketoisovalerate ferredoxin oxidoreductase subunit delta [Firmicutes bacterium ADurb.Bin182]